MKIQVLSDIHFELMQDMGDSFFEGLQIGEVDVLILAGDIATKDLLHHVLTKFCSLFENVVYVTGNHEYYGSSSEDINKILENVSKSFSNFHWLSNSSVNIGEQRFIGGTMWFKDDPLSEPYKKGMNCFRAIQEQESWFYDQNALFIENVVKNMNENDIIVSHHLPSNACVSEAYKNSFLNCFFVCDLTNEILDKKPKLWVHGHTHSSHNFMIGETRIVCNPRGYDWEKIIRYDESPVVVEV